MAAPPWAGVKPLTTCERGRRTSPELLLNPVVIHRSEFESVMIETAINSVRAPWPWAHAVL